MAYTTADPDLLRAALAGYELQKEVLEGRIAELRRELGGGDGRPDETGTELKRVSATPAKARRKMSAAGRKRIIAATRKRWAAWRAAKAAAK